MVGLPALPVPNSPVATPEAPAWSSGRLSGIAKLYIAVYEKGKENLHAMREQGWLVRDERPSFYVYRVQQDEHVQTGVVAASSLEDYLESDLMARRIARETIK